MKISIELPVDFALVVKKMALERRQSVEQLVVAALERELREPTCQAVPTIRQLESLDRSPWNRGEADSFVARSREAWD